MYFKYICCNHIHSYNNLGIRVFNLGVLGNIEKCINFCGCAFLKWLKFEKHIRKKLCPFFLLHTTLKPIFKKGASTDPKNYLPISLLPLVSKMIEKSIYFQIEGYLNKKTLIYMYQSGFRANHSTDLFLAQLIDVVVTSMDKQMNTSMMLVDLQKAFDTLDHGVLL